MSNVGGGTPYPVNSAWHRIPLINTYVLSDDFGLNRTTSVNEYEKPFALPSVP